MIKAILFDISGVLHVDHVPVRGAVELLDQLQSSDLQLRFVTNTSRSTCADILQSLNIMGFAVDPAQVFTAALAVKHVLLRRKLRPFCLIHPQLTPEFSDIDQTDPDAVVIADAAHRFDYEQLNHAFRLVLDGAPLLGIGLNRYFKSADQLQLDAGPFIKALEYATGIEAEILGKPAAGFFQAAVDSVGCQADEVLMIGDDAVADVEGALAVGLQACLVKTGKYLPGDEDTISHPGARLAKSVVEAVETIL